MFNKEIIKEFQKNAIFLEQITGTPEFAFKYSTLIDVLQICRENDIGIWGGDVLDFDSRGKYTGDSWYTNSKKNLDYKEFVKKSIKKTEDYIRSLPNFELLLYVLVFCENEEEYLLSLDKNIE